MVWRGRTPSRGWLEPSGRAGWPGRWRASRRRSCPGPAPAPAWALGPTIAILVALGFIVSWAAGVWTEVLWFDALGFTSVFVTELTTKILLFAVGFVVTAARRLEA